MRMQLPLVLLISLTLAVAAKPAPKPAPKADPKVAAARAAAESFLKLIDAGQFDKAYGLCAVALKQKAKQDMFVGAMSGLRSKLGANTLRNFFSATPKTELPGAPKGKYVVLMYVSDFAKQKGLRELITPMQEADGSWKVAGYYVQK